MRNKNQFISVVEHNPLAHFVCMGDGALQDEVAHFVSDNGLSGNVHLLDYHDAAERIVAAFDISVDVVI